MPCARAAASLLDPSVHQAPAPPPPRPPGAPGSPGAPGLWPPTPAQSPRDAKSGLYPLPHPRHPAGSRKSITGWPRVQLWALTATWLLAVAAFWAWWLAPAQRGTPWLFVVNAVPMLYVTTVLPSFYWYFVTNARTPLPRPAPPGMRVAVITPCVPSSESLAIVEQQLQALAALTYPCDRWILDEGDDPEIAALAARYGVRHFTRRGQPQWNAPGPPFQAKTKAGNVNAWIDRVLRGGLDYEVFVQLDVDHRPVPDYLERTLGYFDDPRVAWVQAPSVSGNLGYWTARGQAEQETALQGPLQMGFYGHSATPFIIGSHTSYRMSAIRAIGGYQPTRAEDHLDTVVLAAHGYTGVYLPEVIATGDGPTTFSTYLGQQFAWAYSLIQIFLHHTPRLLRHYQPRQAFQFLMAQSWYMLWSLACLVLWCLPLVALLTGLQISTVTLSSFAVHYGPVFATATLMWWWSRSLFQPRGVFLSWRGIVLECARWPIVQWATLNVLLRIKRPYMITPKGQPAGALVRGQTVYAPFFGMAWLASAVIALYLFAGGPLASAGYLWLAFSNAGSMLLVVFVASLIEVHQLRGSFGPRAVLQQRGGTQVTLTLSIAVLVWLGFQAGDLLRLTIS